ncbi:MAG: hypothetical protein Q4C81_00995 [Kocuria sp.]|nr:hypothetical protein [Kocuria sp.]
MAFVSGVIAPLLATDRIRERAAETLQMEQEIEIAVIFGKWFAVLSNILSLCLLSLVVAGVASLATRRMVSERALAVRLTLQIILCGVLASIFLLGAM